MSSTGAGRGLNPTVIAASLAELWSPKVVAEVDDAYVKVAKLHGAFEWHAHTAEDELFMVLRGALRIDLEGGSVHLGEGELYVVPKGVRHCPVALKECLVMLVERKTTLHTGDTASDRSRSIEQQLWQT